MNRHRYICVVAIVCTCLYVPLSAQSSIKWSKLSLTEALDKASRQDKLVFVDTYTKTCAPCKVMDKELSNRKLATYFNKKFINLKVDMDTPEGRAVKEQYELIFLPTLLILDGRGTVHYKADQVVPAAELLQKSKLVVEHGALLDESSTISHSPVPAQQRGATLPTATAPVEVASTPAATPDDDNEPEGRILYVLGNSNAATPPPILREEAYFRMQLDNGSHLATARKYLATQSDWTTPDNVRFVYDFLYDAQGEWFDFFIANKALFVDAIGAYEVEQTISILVTQRLERGYPRPDLAEAKKLYTILGLPSATRSAYAYTLDYLRQAGRNLSYLDIVPLYIAEVGTDDHQQVHEACMIYVEAGRPGTTASSEQYISWLREAIQHSPDQPYYYQTLAHLYHLTDQKALALNALEDAEAAADRANVSFTVDKAIAAKIKRL